MLSTLPKRKSQVLIQIYFVVWKCSKYGQGFLIIYKRLMVWTGLKNFYNLPNDKALDWSKLKAFADEKINVTQSYNLFWDV